MSTGETEVLIFFRATAIRKYMATAIQMMALPKYQLEWVAEHLGHDLAIHKKFYRQSIDTVETTKIAKVMHLVDNCKMHEAVGLNIEDIDQLVSQQDLERGTEPEDYEASQITYYILLYHQNENDDCLTVIVVISILTNQACNLAILCCL